MCVAPKPNPCLLQGHRVLILDGIRAAAEADLAQAASAALAGTSPEDYYQTSSACRDASSAAAVLVAGLIALKAASQRTGGGGSGSGRSSPRLMGSSSGSPELWPVAAAGSPAARRARPCSAPCKGKGGERSPSPVVSLVLRLV